MPRTKTCCPSLRNCLDTRLFKALGDSTRVGILIHLGECCRPMTVNDIAQCSPIDLSVVSRHLACFRDASVLEASKDGREVHYTVSHTKLTKILRDLADVVESCCSLRTEPIRGSRT